MKFRMLLMMGVVLMSALRVSAQDATFIVTEAYQEVLGRKPDPKGLSEFRSKVIDKDWTSEDVKKALRNSDEYADKVITEAFQDLLGRRPDKGALETYRPKIRQKGWSAKDVRNEIRKSQEYKNRNK